MKAQTKSKPTSKKIFEYWKNICLEEPKKVLYSLFDDARYENIIEGNEKTCFCCGYEGYVERAHIIPLALGGTNSLENLLLLCSKCHADSPDVTDTKYMFAWLNQQPYSTSRYLAAMMGLLYPDDLATLERLLSHFDNMAILTELAQLSFSSEIKIDCIMSHYQKIYEIKMRQANTHGFIFSESTRAAVMNQALLETVDLYKSITSII